MRLFLLILSLALLIGCIKANTLSEVLIGEWTLDHYEAYKDGNPTTAAGSLDKSIKFSSNGRCQWNGKASFDYSLSGDLGIAFIYGSWTNQPYTIKACPKEDSGYEAKSYNLVTDKNYTGIYVEYGRWYAFSTSSVDDTEGSINVNYPNWNEGSTNP